MLFHDEKHVTTKIRKRQADFSAAIAEADKFIGAMK
jgi:hypothetical protein